jgi:Plasmid pRiA4b ORF-3-like protein
MSKQTSMGTCHLCGQRFSRLTMTRHLKTCGLPAAQPPAASGSARQRPGQSFHLFVEGRYAKMYWMHLAVPAQIPLGDLDAFLRQIWLECCGHLSAFNIAGERYSGGPMYELEEPGMGARLSRLLEPGLAFTYEYDFGTTTELNLKVLGLRDQSKRRSEIELLARNDDPQFPCNRCGNQPATQICMECVYQGKGWLCDTCAASHKCGEDMFLPVVNSPRTGVCGYTG